MTAAAQDPGSITDEEIVAFLDGQLGPDRQGEIAMAAAADPAVADRIEELSPDLGAMRTGMDALLDHVPDLPVPEFRQATNDNRPGWSMSRVAAAAVVAFAVGLGAGFGALHLDTTPGWHRAVADYQVLYTDETVTGTPLTPDLRAGGLQRVSTRMGLPLTEETLKVTGLGFQRAQMLEFEGEPLAQIVFLDGNEAPIAFCLMKATGGAEGLADTEISGLNATTWSDGTYSYIVIGPAERSTIRDAAEELSTRLPV